jgi:hypothetical protein
VSDIAEIIMASTLLAIVVGAHVVTVVVIVTFARADSPPEEHPRIH